MAKIKIKIWHIIILFILIAVFLPVYARFMELREKDLYLEKEIDRVEDENIRLYKEVKKLEEDLDYVEKVARDTMGLAKEGEIPIQIEFTEETN